MRSAFLEALALARPDPGGGAAAVHGAALGVALLTKVVKLERQRQEAVNRADFSWDDLLERVGQVATALERLQKEDVWSYLKFCQARNDSDSDKLAAALEDMLGCPLRIMQQSQEGLALISQAGARCKRHLLADLLVACELLGAAFRGAHHIARANLDLMSAGPQRDIWAENLAHTLKAAEAMLQQVCAELLERYRCR
jgi:formiminotetrahydrofolate cyclodeaminase